MQLSATCGAPRSSLREGGFCWLAHKQLHPESRSVTEGAWLAAGSWSPGDTSTVCVPCEPQVPSKGSPSKPMDMEVSTASLADLVEAGMEEAEGHGERGPATDPPSGHDWAQGTPQPHPSAHLQLG